MRPFACIKLALSAALLIHGSYALPQQIPNDIAQSNGYNIQHCSLLTPHVQEALGNMYDVLLKAIPDTHYGEASAPYKAWFKSSYYETMVEEILKDVLIGAPFQSPGRTKPSIPDIVCALKPNTAIVELTNQKVDVYSVCKRNSFTSIMFYPDTSTIYLCSRFFLLPPVPSEDNCPTVNEATNEFEGNFIAFWKSQIYFLLHEIVRFYTDSTMLEERPDETMNYNYAFSLSPVNAALNPLNYVLYVACVDKECHNYPKADKSPPTRGRRLGAMLDLLNTSSIEAAQSQRSGLTGEEVLPFHTDVVNATLAANVSNKSP